MDTRIRKTCHVCGKGNLLQLNNHLTQMHGWNSQMKKEYKQRGFGMSEYMQRQTYNQKGAGLDYNLTQVPTVDHDGDVFSKSYDDEQEEGSDGEEYEEEMEESDDDDQDSNDHICSDDEENSGIWDSFRREVMTPYQEDTAQKLDELRGKYPDAPDRELKELVMDQYRNKWIEEAAAHLKDIITYYEKFQDMSGFFEKIMLMREQLAKTEGEEEALAMAINLYKHKFGSLFSCSGFDIPE